MNEIIEKYEAKLDYLNKAVEQSKHLMDKDTLDTMNHMKILLTEVVTDFKDRTYTLDEVITLIKAFHLDTQEGKYSKELLDWCNKWIEDNIKNPI